MAKNKGKNFEDTTKLQAADQQLKATKQQLKVASQQLRADEEQIKRINRDMAESIEELNCLRLLKNLEFLVSRL